MNIIQENVDKFSTALDKIITDLNGNSKRDKKFNNGKELQT